jgi:hypothetical protein
MATGNNRKSLKSQKQCFEQDQDYERRYASKMCDISDEENNAPGTSSTPEILDCYEDDITKKELLYGCTSGANKRFSINAPPPTPTKRRKIVPKRLAYDKNRKSIPFGSKFADNGFEEDEIEDDEDVLMFSQKDMFIPLVEGRKTKQQLIDEMEVNENEIFVFTWFNSTK